MELSNSVLETIFNNMEYGFKNECPNLMVNWMDTNLEWICYFIESCGKVFKWDSDKLSINLLPASSRANFFYSEKVILSWFNADKFERVGILRRLSSLLEANSLLFAQLDVLLRNVPIGAVLEYDIPYFIKYFKQCSHEPLKLPYYVKNQHLPVGEAVTIKINSVIPLYDICWKICPLLVCGLPMKLVVDDNALLIIVLFVKLCIEAGVPESVFELVSIESLKDNFKDYNVQSVALIFDKVDVNSVVDSVIQGAWAHNSLVPWAIKRVLVHETVHDVFLSKLLDKQSQIRSGSAFSMLSVITKPHFKGINDNTNSIIKKSKSEGFMIHQTYSMIADFSNPTVIVGRPQCMLENTFSTAITVEKFTSTEECVKLIKNSRLLSSASLWSDSQSTLHKAFTLLMKETNLQTIWLNYHGFLDPDIPFFVDGLHSVKEDIRSCIFQNAFPGIKIMKFNPENPDVLSRVNKGILNTDTVDNILEAASKAAKSWFTSRLSKIGPIFSAAAVDVFSCFNYIRNDSNAIFTSENIDTLIKVLVNCSSMLRNRLSFQQTEANVILFSSNSPRGVVLLVIHELEEVFNLFHTVISFIVNGNSLIIIVEDDIAIKRFYECLVKCGLPKDLISIIKNVEQKKVVNSKPIMSVSDIEQFFH